MNICITLNKLTEILGDVVFEGNYSGNITGISSLKNSKDGDLSFIRSLKYRDELLETNASCVLIPEDFEVTPKENQLFLRVKNPSLAFAIICRYIEKSMYPKLPGGIHPSAIVHETAEIDPTASIGPYCVIESAAKVGPHVVLKSHVYLGSAVVIGEHSFLMPHVTVLDFCEIGKNVKLHSGVVIGSDGFGYEMINGVHEKVPQIGKVVIEDNVEIGSNSCIDRARFEETRIGAGTKIDNLVQIAHNVVVGKNCILVSQVGVSGSTQLGDYVLIGGQTGLTGHIKVGDRSKIGAQSGVSKDVPCDSYIKGSPAQSVMAEYRQEACIRKLPQLFQKIQKLEKTIKYQEEREHIEI